MTSEKTGTDISRIYSLLMQNWNQKDPAKPNFYSESV